MTVEKRMRLFICGSYAIASDHAVFPAATNKIKYVPKADTKAKSLSLLLVTTLLLIAVSVMVDAGEIIEEKTLPTLKDIAGLPCIPIWARSYEAPIVGEYTRGYTTSLEEGFRNDYQNLIQLPLTSDISSVYFDESLGVTEVMVGDYPNDCIIMHSVDADLGYVETVLPVSYGVPWIIVDLDLDGNVEVVLQRGDGSNGFLDIISAPEWDLRTHIILESMNVHFYPVAVNVDEDPYLELYLTPSVLFGPARAMIVNYDPNGDTFVVTDDLSAPVMTGGPSAVGDFDEDGKIEFITGSYYGYELFEYTKDGLTNIGTIEELYPGNWATALRPLPDDKLYALLGHSSGPGWYYQLLRATGDNAFELVHLFFEDTPWHGVSPSFALDADNDGLDEFVMNFYPKVKMFEWDTNLEEFCNTWTLDQRQDSGTLIKWAATDLDQDGVREWCCEDHEYILRAFEDQSVGLACQADFDYDSDVDLNDFANFAQCYGGEDNPPSGACPPEMFEDGYSKADFNQDGDVDWDDFALFVQCFGGAGNPPNC